MSLPEKRMCMKSDLFSPVIPQFLEFCTHYGHLWKKNIPDTPQSTFHPVATIILLEEVEDKTNQSGCLMHCRASFSGEKHDGC